MTSHKKKENNKPVWNKPKPRDSIKPKKLNSEEKSEAKTRAKKAGRTYPNLIALKCNQ